MKPQIAVYESREDWLAARRRCITATDVGQLAGLSKWGDSLSVYADKMGEGPDKSSIAMLLGQKLQRGIADAYGEIRSADDHSHILIEPVPEWALVGTGLHKSSMDAFQTIDSGDPHPLEIKMTRDFLEAPRDEWLTQVQWQMFCCDANRATIAALCGGETVRWWDIERDDEAITSLREIAGEFWRNHILTQTPPPVGQFGAPARRLFPKSMDGTEVVLGPAETEAAIEISKLREKQAEIEHAITQQSAIIQMAMQGAETAYLTNGWRVSWKTIQRRAYYAKASEFRKFSITEPKGK